MPNKPLKPCSKIGCPNLTQERWCDEHRQEKYSYDKERGNSTERGYDADWKKLRLVALQREPLCRHCKQKGKITIATEVDHIIPIARGGARLDLNNLQSLCKSCHSYKTATEDSTFVKRKS